MGPMESGRASEKREGRVSRDGRLGFLHANGVSNDGGLVWEK